MSSKQSATFGNSIVIDSPTHGECHSGATVTVTATATGEGSIKFYAFAGDPSVEADLQKLLSATPHGNSAAISDGGTESVDIQAPVIGTEEQCEAKQQGALNLLRVWLEIEPVNPADPPSYVSAMKVFYAHEPI